MRILRRRQVGPRRRAGQLGLRGARALCEHGVGDCLVVAAALVALLVRKIRLHVFKTNPYGLTGPPRQNQQFGPLLEWFKEEWGVELTTTDGLMSIKHAEEVTHDSSLITDD